MIFHIHNSTSICIMILHYEEFTQRLVLIYYLVCDCWGGGGAAYIQGRPIAAFFGLDLS